MILALPSRPALEALLRGSEPTRVHLVGPPGSGKTVLLSQVLRGRPRSLHWQLLPRGEAGLLEGVDRLVEEALGGLPRVDRPDLLPLRDSDYEWARRFEGIFLALRPEGTEPPGVLVLDGAEWLTGGGRRAMRALEEAWARVHEAAHPVHLVLSLREAPGGDRWGRSEEAVSVPVGRPAFRPVAWLHRGYPPPPGGAPVVLDAQPGGMNAPRGEAGAPRGTGNAPSEEVALAALTAWSVFGDHPGHLPVDHRGHGPGHLPGHHAAHPAGHPAGSGPGPARAPRRPDGDAPLGRDGPQGSGAPPGIALASALEEAVVSRILDSRGDLHDRPLRELEATFQSPRRYLEILVALARGAQSWGGLAQAPGTGSGNTLAPYLARLEAAGWVTVDEPLDGAPGGRRRRYRLADPFHDFWFAHVLPWRTLLPLEGPRAVYRERIAPHLLAHAARWLPELVRRWLAEHARERLPAPAREVGGLWADGVEIPVAARLRGGQMVYGVCDPGPGAEAPPDADAALLVGLEQAMREVRWGLGRETRIPLVALLRPPSESLVRQVTRTGTGIILTPADLLVGPEGEALP